jgi:acetoacetate decarboxylase
LSHPAAPWHLHGELVIVPSPSLAHPVRGVFLADYQAGTLQYHELIVISHVTPRGLVVSHIYVDDEQSLSGGREIWGLPKELAEFDVSRRSFIVRQAGNLLLRASIRRKPGWLPIFIPAPITSRAGEAFGRARVKAAPALVSLEIPDESPFAHLGLAGRYVGLAGDDMQLTMPAPLRRSAGIRARQTA